jgi:Flp pilus assembly protein TadG
MRRAIRLAYRDCNGTAAVEMALVLPLLLALMYGSVELGNYFMNQHSLVKAVRDGARFAARQNFSNYPDCSTVNTTVRDNTRNVVMYGYLSGTAKLTPNISASNITLTVSCASAAGGQNMLGIYRSRFGATCNGSSAGGCAQIVQVTAAVTYRPVLEAFGFTGRGYRLYASSQAAVAGI